MKFLCNLSILLKVFHIVCLMQNFSFLFYLQSVLEITSQDVAHPDLVPFAVPKGDAPSRPNLSPGTGPGAKKQGVSGESAAHSTIKGAAECNLEKHEKDFR